MAVQRRNSENISILSVDFQKRYEANFAAGNAVSLLRMIPGLRAAWIASTFDENYHITDLSDQGRTVFYRGNPEFGHTGLAPWVFMDGGGDYFNRPDEAGLDIIGTESGILTDYRGLSMGGWFNLSSTAGYDIFMGKWGDAANQSFVLWHDHLNTDFVFSITSDGTAGTQVNVTSSVTPAANQWYFIVGTFDPSNSLNIYVNGAKSSLAVGIPASIFSGNGPFEIGNANSGSGLELNGYFSLGFLSSMFLTDTVVNNLYQQTRALYDVQYTAPDALLMETGDYLLLETGDKILLE